MQYEEKRVQTTKLQLLPNKTGNLHTILSLKGILASMIHLSILSLHLTILKSSLTLSSYVTFSLSSFGFVRTPAATGAMLFDLQTHYSIHYPG